MAEVQIRSAFVDKVLIGKDGPFGVRTSEPHSRKNQAGGYETIGRTFRTIRGKDIDWTQFQEGDRIAVFGREVTEEREHEGKKFYDLIVWADGVSTVPRKGAGSPQGASGGGYQPQGAPAPTAPAQEPWPTAQPGGGNDVPF